MCKILQLTLTKWLITISLSRGHRLLQSKSPRVSAQFLTLSVTVIVAQRLMSDRRLELIRQIHANVGSSQRTLSERVSPSHWTCRMLSCAVEAFQYTYTTFHMSTVRPFPDTALLYKVHGTEFNGLAWVSVGA